MFLNLWPTYFLKGGLTTDQNLNLISKLQVQYFHISDREVE